KFVTQLTQQIGNEFSAHQQYVAIATYYDGLTMPQMAALFYQQALEERDHAMMMVQYLLDADEDVAVPGVDTPKSGFKDVVEPVQLAPDQEQQGTEQINEHPAIARSANGCASDPVMHWASQQAGE